VPAETNLAYRVLTSLGRPGFLQECDAALPDAWPVIANQNPTCAEHWPALMRTFPEYQFALQDLATDAFLAVGNSLPLHWEGDFADLPDEGWDWALPQGLADHAAGRVPNVLCALSITVPVHLRGQGVSYQAIRAMCELARAHGLPDLIVPARPTLKHRYPLTPIARYVTWITEEGLPFDPWLRAHARAGGRVLHPCARSETTVAPLADWEKWTGMRFPESGEYILPDGMTPLAIDTTRGVGTYVEPNVWVHHDLRGTG
jgi:hypothetical protein